MVFFFCAGILNWAVTLGGIIGARYFKCPLNVLLDKFPLLLAPSLILGLVLGLIIFFTSHRDSHTPKNNFIVEFVFGRSPAAKLGPINLKQLIFRLSLLSCVSFNLLLFNYLFLCIQFFFILI